MSAVSLLTLEQFCNNYLDINKFKDYCPNGLQIEGKSQVKKLVGGVTASLALIEAAIKANADAILVHHGYFWKGESETLTGIKGRRIKKLLQHDLSLLAYHLPLDAHPIVGNNTSLIKQLDLPVSHVSLSEKNALLNIIELSRPYTASELAIQLETQLNRAPLWIKAGPEQVKKIAVCTGAAQSMLTDAAQEGCDAFISGEISEKTTHEARENGIHYFASGHHATEKGGVQNLGAVIAENFGIHFEFIDIPNPV